MRPVILSAALITLLASLITEFSIFSGEVVNVWRAVSCTLAVISSSVLFLMLLLKGQPTSTSFNHEAKPALALGPEKSALPATPLIEDVPSPMIGPEATRLLNNIPWLKLVEECVGLVEEFDHHMASFNNSQRDLAKHVISRVEEALERCGVEVISTDSKFDRNRHQSERGGGPVSPDAAIAEFVSPGFAVGSRVFRRARVRLITTSNSG